MGACIKAASSGNLMLDAFRRGNELLMKGFLAAGNVLINPTLLAYAVVETDSDGLQLRLGFTAQAGSPPCEIRLEGLEARSVIRWLRTNSEFLDAGSTSRRREPVTTLGCSSRYASDATAHSHEYVLATGTTG